MRGAFIPMDQADIPDTSSFITSAQATTIANARIRSSANASSTAQYGVEPGSLTRLRPPKEPQGIRVMTPAGVKTYVDGLNVPSDIVCGRLDVGRK